MRKSPHFSFFPMSFIGTIRYPNLPHWQGLHTENNLKGFDVLSSFSYIGLGLLMTLLLYRYQIPEVEKGAIRKLGGFPIFTAWTFFTKRYDFIWENFGNDPSPHFKFNVLHVWPLSLCHWPRTDHLRSMQHNVIALRGEEARKAYFDDKGLSFAEGYKVLRGGVRPSLYTSYQWIDLSEYFSLDPFN
jgi:sterol 14-demethylase